MPLARNRSMRVTARREWPPRVKKLSCGPNRPVPRTSANRPRRIFSAAGGFLADRLGCCPGRGRGQGGLIEFAVDRQGQRVKQDDGGWPHVLGQDGRQLAVDGLGIDAAAGAACPSAGVGGGPVNGLCLVGAGQPDEVGDQFRPGRPAAAGHDGGLADARQGQQHLLDLARLDPVAADLDLAVGAAQVLKYPPAASGRGPRSGTSPSRRPVRAGGEALRGHPGPAQVPPRQLLPATTVSPVTPAGTGCRAASSTYTRVFQVGRPSGTHRPAAAGPARPGGRSRRSCGFRRPVLVDDRHARVRAPPARPAPSPGPHLPASARPAARSLARARPGRPGDSASPSGRQGAPSARHRTPSA